MSPRPYVLPVWATRCRATGWRNRDGVWEDGPTEPTAARVAGRPLSSHRSPTPLCLSGRALDPVVPPPSAISIVRHGGRLAAGEYVPIREWETRSASLSSSFPILVRVRREREGNDDGARGQTQFLAPAGFFLLGLRGGVTAVVPFYLHVSHRGRLSFGAAEGILLALPTLATATQSIAVPVCLATQPPFLLPFIAFPPFLLSPLLPLASIPHCHLVSSRARAVASSTLAPLFSGMPSLSTSAEWTSTVPAGAVSTASSRMHRAPSSFFVSFFCFSFFLSFPGFLYLVVLHYSCVFASFGTVAGFHLHLRCSLLRVA